MDEIDGAGAPRCQLPGCSTPITPSSRGGEPRKYCCPAHRSAARRLRFEAKLDASAETPTLVLTRAPDERVPVPTAPRPLATPRPAPLPAPRRRPRGALLAGAVGVVAVAGIVGGLVLAAGGGESHSAAPVADVPTAPAIPLGPVAVPAGAQEWAERARPVLAALQAELDQAIAVERSWSALPEAARAGHEGGPVTELGEFRVLAAQEVALLTAELGALEELQGVVEAAAVAEERMSRTRRVLADAPTDDPAGGPARDRLAAQEQAARVELRAQRRGGAGLHATVTEAMGRPLPELGRGPSLTAAVLELIEEHEAAEEPASVASEPVPAPATGAQVPPGTDEPGRPGILGGELGSSEDQVPYPQGPGCGPPICTG